jgi:hypothetical protein
VPEDIKSARDCNKIVTEILSVRISTGMVVILKKNHGNAGITRAVEKNRPRMNMDEHG